MSRILVVDDVPAMAEQYRYDLARIANHDVAIATGGAAALEQLGAGGVDCVILDLEMPGIDGFEVLRSLRHRGIEVPVIVYTGTGNYDRCVEAIRLGAVGFIDKAEPMERVAQEVASALERHRLRQEVRALQRRLGESSLLGSSPAMTRLKDQIARIAPIPSTVLIEGESGTGKELVARELHRLSGRADQPFVALNCAALPEQLVESELFGHERGAFTGAIGTRKGAFEAAEGGTLFLDEVGELPLAAQAKLLRVLEQRTVSRVGSVREIAVAARVLAATNRELDREVAAERFREDLLYRLNVHRIRVPPLRERREDIGPLAARFVDESCRQFGFLPKTLSAEVRERLTSLDWRRNNVRELRNTVERMVALADGEMLRLEHLVVDPDDGPAGDDPGTGTFQEQRALAERRIVVAALERHDWHVTRTALALGLADHASLLKIMRRLGIRRG